MRAGWWIFVEVDVALGEHDIVRPDLAGWRRERLPRPGTARPIDVVPDWVCEILSPSTAARDRVTKRALLRKELCHALLASRSRNARARGIRLARRGLGAVDVGGAVTQISAGGDHTCALLADQSVRCWGRGTNGQLGYGNTDNIGDTETPASLQDPVDVGGAVTFLDAGASHTCAALASGSLRCWGDGFGNKLGYGNTEAIGDNEDPASAGDIAW